MPMARPCSRLLCLLPRWASRPLQLLLNPPAECRNLPEHSRCSEEISRGLRGFNPLSAIIPALQDQEIAMSFRMSLKLRRVSIALGIAVLLSCVQLTAQTLPRGVQKGPSLAGITEYTYANGLKVLLLPDSGSSSITVNMVYLVGSRHEGYGESGMAHLLEHLLFIKST